MTLSGRRPCDPGRLSHRDRALHSLVEVAERAADGSSRRLGRRARHGAGDRRDAARSQHYRLPVDCDRPGAGILHRRAAGTRPHDRRSTADRAQPRVRRAVRHAGGHRRVLSPRARRAAFHDERSLDGGHTRLADLHRKPDGRGQTAGNPAAAAHHLQGPEHRQPLAAGGRDRHRRRIWCPIPGTSGCSC